MTNYLAYGRNLSSEIPLPELEPTTAPADIFITTGSGRVELEKRRTLVDATGDVWLIVGETAGGTALSFPGAADFVVDLTGRRVTCYLTPQPDLGAARHALLDHVLPRLLVANGGTVLHASGVVAAESAVLWAGLSGSGKSTLAARSAATGLPLLGDDAMALEVGSDGWRVQPSYPGLRLWRDSMELLETHGRASPISAGSTKSRVEIRLHPPTVPTDHPLSSIVMIDRRPGSTEGRRLAGSEAFSRLWGTRFDWPGTALDRNLVDRIAALAAEATILSVAFPDGAPVEEILDVVGELTASR